MVALKQKRIILFLIFFLLLASCFLLLASSALATDCEVDCDSTCSIYTDPDQNKDCQNKCKADEATCVKLNKQTRIYENILKLNDKQQDTLSNQLDYINQQQDKNQQDLQGAVNELDDLSSKIGVLERNIADKEKSIEYQKKILAGLMQSYYEYDQQGLLKIILLDQNLSDSLSSSDYIEQSGVKVTEMLADIHKNREDLIKNREELKQDYKESAKLKDELQYTKSNLQLTESQKQSLLLQTQGQEQKYKDLLAHIEEQKKELFNFSEASNLQEVFDSLKNYPKPDKKYWASTAWYFSQKDSRWANQRIGNSKSLMKDYGCAVASVSMVFRKFGSSTDPGKMAKEKIFYYDLIKWPASWSPNISLVSSVSHGNVNWTKIKSEINDGNPIIVYIKKTNGRGGHYVVITGYDKDEKKYVVHDPYFGSNLYLDTSQSLIGKLGADSRTVVDQMIIYN